MDSTQQISGHQYRIIICSAGTSPALGTAKCFRKFSGLPCYIITTDIEEHIPAKNFADKHIQVPPYSSSNYFQFLEEIVKKEKIELIFPTHLDEILYLCNNYSRLPGWFKNMAVLNPPDSVLTANNKIQTYKLWEQQGGKIPTLFLRISEINQQDLPVIAKPLHGRSRGYEAVFKIDTRDELEKFKRNHKSPDFIFQQYIDGIEYSIDFVVKEKSLFGVCARTREKKSTGLSIKGQTVDVLPFSHIIRRVLEIIPGIQFGNIQIITDSRGNKYLIEVNPKLPGTLIHSAAAGLNMPLILADLKLRKKTASPVVKTGINMIRYYEEFFYESRGNEKR